MSATDAIALSAEMEAAGNIAGAEKILRAIIAAAPHHVAYNRLGAIVFARGGRYEALYLFDRAVKASRRYVPGLANRGTLLAEMGHAAEAEADLRLAVHLDPKNAIAWNALGNLLMRSHDLDGSLRAINRTLSLSPDSPVAHFNRGCVLSRLGQHEQAIAEFDLVIAREPAFADALYNRAVCKMAIGLPEGRFEYEARFKSSEPVYVAPSQAPRWNGEPGKTILVWAEQGIGDAIMFMRYVDAIRFRFRGRVLLYVHEQLRELCRRHFAPSDLVVLETDKDLPPHDCQHPLMSSPLIFPEAPEQWRPRETVFGCSECSLWGGLIGGGLRVGICWAGNPKHANDHNRSIPFKVFSDILGTRGVHFYSLQKDVPDRQDLFAGGQPFTDLAPHLTDMCGTAHAIGRLDIVITVDTAVAHLAASVGARTYLLLPHNADYRWPRSGDTTPWYPSMKLFRQSSRGDWRSVMREVRADLDRLTSVKSVA